MLFQERELKLRGLASELRQIKPEGWSIVFGKDEVVARTKDRTIGKFRIICLRQETFTVAFFSRELNIWNKTKVFSEGPNVASLIKDWMLARVLIPGNVKVIEWSSQQAIALVGLRASKDSLDQRS